MPSSSQDNLSVTFSSENENIIAKVSQNPLDDDSESISEIPRTPSLMLQELLASRGPAAIMATLRSGSQSVLHSCRQHNSHENQDNPTGAKSFEAVKSRRKNRRKGK